MVDCVILVKDSCGNHVASTVREVPHPSLHTLMQLRVALGLHFQFFLHVYKHIYSYISFFGGEGGGGSWFRINSCVPFILPACALFPF